LIRIERDQIAITPARRRVRAAPDETTGDVRPIVSPDADGVAVSAHLRVTYRGGIGVFDHMDEPLIERLAADDALAWCAEELWDEIVAGRPGARAMVETLVRRCLILLLRRCAGRRTSWLAALEDARLGRAVGAMQACPEGTFTLSTLAEEAGMSRSVFAARFTSVLGEPPMEFLKTLRLARAAELLTRTDLPVKTIASEVGYSSRSSFTRAFVGRYGSAPARFRCTAGAPRGAPCAFTGGHPPGVPRAAPSSPATLPSWPTAS
jgi:AraC-like DNA-binding protein